MEEPFRYDAVVKDLFEKDRPSLLDKLLRGRRVEGSMNTEFPVVMARVADLLLELEGKTVLHLDFQSANDRDMPFREGIYGLLIAQKYRCRRVEQVVVYMGKEKMNMARRLDLGGIRVTFRLIDIREIRLEELLDSGRPGGYSLALLARGGVARLREIVERANGLPEPQRRRVLTQMAILAGLRGASKRLKMEMEHMGLSLDIQENVFLKEIYESGEAKGKVEGRVEGRVEGMVALLREQLAAKFGPLPQWAENRLDKATLANAELWAKKVLTARTIEGVLGKK